MRLVLYAQRGAEPEVRHLVALARTRSRRSDGLFLNVRLWQRQQALYDGVGGLYARERMRACTRKGIIEGRDYEAEGVGEHARTKRDGSGRRVQMHSMT